MKKRICLVLACALLLTLAACQKKAPAPTTDAPIINEVKWEMGVYQTITPSEAKNMLDQGKEVTLVDVRRADEYAGGHIPGAIHVANEEIGTTQPEALPNLDDTILVYCRSGRRSKEAAEKLLQMGYTNVWDLGGIQDWPYETVTGEEPGAWTVTEAATGGILSSFSTTDLDGNAVGASVLADYELTMVNAWATFCGPCLREMPELGELAAEYQEKNVQIVGLVTDVLNSDGSLSEKQLQTARDIVSSTQANYPHLVPSEDLFGLVYQITSVPTTFFVDKDGKQVGYTYVGVRDKAAWTAIIEETLAEVSK